MEPAKKGITVTQGETFRLAFRLYSRNPDTGATTYMDLTGYTGRCVVREFPNSAAITTLTVTIDPDQVTNRGLVRLYGSPVTTALIDRDGIWAVSLTAPNGDIDTWVEGPVKHKVSVART